MRVVVDFQGESLELEVPDDRVVACWRGPDGLDAFDGLTALDEALEHPRDFPPLRQMIVPGDRVAIALDPEVPHPRSVLEAFVNALGRSGVGLETITVVAPRRANGPMDALAATGLSIEVHDPDDRARIAYLASTKQGRRVYLNRTLTDADVVVPVGLLGFNADLGYRGPWSVLFPELCDRQTIQSLRDRSGAGFPAEGDHGHDMKLEECFEVSWLLGSQFFLGIVPGASGLLDVVAGRDATVRQQGIASVEQNWTMRAPSRAEVVIAGVGGPGTVASLEDLGLALDTATNLVQHGGKIVILSRATGPIGPALQRLLTVDDPREASAALRGHEDDDDYPTARRIARASAWADLFVCSALEADVAEELGLTPLDRPEQARRLAAGTSSLTTVSRAERTRAMTADEAERGDHGE